LEVVKQYKKVHSKVYTLCEEFFKKHSELIFLRFDFTFIIEIVNRILLPGIREENFEIKSAALLTIDHLNEFIYNNLKRPSKKQPQLAQNVN